MAKLLDDVNTALQKARSLGGAQAAQLPSQLTAADKQQAEDAIKDLNVEIYTGKDDKILRRFVVTIKLAVPNKASAGTQPADVKLDFQLQDLNESQDDQRAREHQAVRRSCWASSGPRARRARRRGRRLGLELRRLLRRERGEPREVLATASSKAGGDTAKAQKCADLLTP